MAPPRFTVLGPLPGGFGSQAMLGRVHEESGTKPVVLIHLPEGVDEHPEVLEQIVGETRLASRIDHPNVIGVWGVTRLETGTVRVVDYANGEPLRAILRRAREKQLRFSPQIAAAIIADACMGTHYAHELGLSEQAAPLVHGGLRPETLLVSYKGRALVTGYGAATLAEWFRRGLGMDASIRDPYTSPEQAFGGRAAANVPTDVYALGAIFFELLTMESPIGQHTGLDPAGHRALIEEKLEGIGVRYSDVVVKAMRGISSDRFPTPLEMNLALRDAGVAEPSEVAAFLEALFPPNDAGRTGRQALFDNENAPSPVDAQRPTPDAPALAHPSSVVDADQHAGVELRSDRDSTKARTAPATPVSRMAPKTSVPAQPTPAPATPVLATPTPAPAQATAPLPRPPEQAAQAFDDLTHTDPVPRVQKRVQTLAAPVEVAPRATIPPTVWALVGLLGGGLAVALLLLLRAPGPVVMPTTTTTPTSPAVSPPAPPRSPPRSPPPGTAAEVPASDAPSLVPVTAPVDRNARGKLRVKASPQLTIAVDGKKRGRTPLLISLPLGSHHVVATARGLVRSRKVFIKKNRTSALFFDIGSANIIVKAPSGSVIHIDGRRRGVAPKSNFSVFPGKHTVLVKKRSAKWKRSFRLRDGEEASVNVTFTEVSR